MILILDTETTGLQAGIDEILQLSIIGLDGSEVFNSYFKPERVTAWKDAERVNHITPEMVADAPSFSELLPTLDSIFADASMIIGYNTFFDLGFLRSSGVIVPHCPVFDCMAAFSPIFGEWSDYRNDYKWQKLTTCAEYYHFDWGQLPPHNSLSDCYATRHVFYHIVCDLYLRGQSSRFGVLFSDILRDVVLGVV